MGSREGRTIDTGLATDATLRITEYAPAAGRAQCSVRVSERRQLLALERMAPSGETANPDGTDWRCPVQAASCECLRRPIEQSTRASAADELRGARASIEPTAAPLTRPGCGPDQPPKLRHQDPIPLARRNLARATAGHSAYRHSFVRVSPSRADPDAPAGSAMPARAARYGTVPSVANRPSRPMRPSHWPAQPPNASRPARRSAPA